MTAELAERSKRPGPDVCKENLKPRIEETKHTRPLHEKPQSPSAGMLQIIPSVNHLQHVQVYATNHSEFRGGKQNFQNINRLSGKAHIR